MTVNELLRRLSELASKSATVRLAVESELNAGHVREADLQEVCIVTTIDEHGFFGSPLILLRGVTGVHRRVKK